ncbi:hypothetical protein ACJ73_02034 [Blastomyces percursus]|uniref:Uncharacterized protein n=1 Tax=Blastomyces percursus TaxID=1658174 RepID=A0A1J9QEN8_9EURO|nr:hypothetical protein ACJ73_02034 [Blastomyces percursus]
MHLPGLCQGRPAIAQIRVEAHLVNALKANILPGMNVMAPEGIIIDPAKRIATISSCQGIQIPICVTAKEHRIRRQPVYAGKRCVIPPSQTARIPIQVKANLAERDYMFDPCQVNTNLAMYTHIADAKFDHIQLTDRTTRPVTLQKKCRLWYLTELDGTEGYVVNEEEKDAGAQDKKEAKMTQVEETSGSREGTSERVQVPFSLSDGFKLPNGVTIYSDAAHMGGRWGFVQIPEEDWMEMPMLNNWQENMPKSRVYPCGPKDQALIDETFDKLHRQGRMRWATGHTPTGHPVFVAKQHTIDPKLLFSHSYTCWGKGSIPWLTTPAEKLKAIVDLSFPQTLKALETYLGMTGALRQYIPYYSHKLAPLQERKTFLLRAPREKGNRGRHMRREKNFCNQLMLKKSITRA